MASRQIKMPQRTCRTRSRESFLAKQAAGARPILATGRPANEEFLHDIGSRAIGGAGHQDGLSDRSGVRV